MNSKKPCIINPKYYPLLANLLEKASDEYANRSCNDYDLSQILPDVEDRRQLAKSMEEQNGSPEEFDPEDDYNTVNDSWLFGYFASLFESYTTAAEVPTNSQLQHAHQELLAAYSIIGALLQFIEKSGTKANNEVSKQINDEILTIRECLTHAENCFPKYPEQFS
ncbi:hypothetical protein CAL7716_102710 (plasmid) [Calothrix sp. PCC 7716]|nr:hypothetical protein CAL7716_102710 [Calothrix sp. PCC 7716]